MGVLLRISLVLLLILSIAALVMGWMLFDQREELKGRLQLAEDTIMEVSRTIETEIADDLAERDLPRMQIDRNQLQSFYQIDAEGKVVRDEETGERVASGHGTMDAALREFRGHAASQYAQLDDTRSELTQTRVVLAATEQELEETQEKLAQTESELEQTRTELAQARETIREQGEEIASLNRDKQRLEDQVAELRDNIAALEDNVADLEHMNKEMDERIKELNSEIASLRAPVDDDLLGDPDATADIEAGFKGEILMVNEEWNFVILYMPEDGHGVLRDLSLFVQREDKLVGKVRVSEIKGADRRLAIAEIMPEWKQMPIQEGDRVFF